MASKPREIQVHMQISSQAYRTVIVTSARTHTNVLEQTKFSSRWWAKEVDHDMSDFPDEITDEEKDWSDFEDTAEDDDFRVPQQSGGVD